MCVHPIRDALGQLGEHVGSQRCSGLGLEHFLRYLRALPAIRVHHKLDERTLDIVHSLIITQLHANARSEWLISYEKEIDDLQRRFRLTSLSVKFLASKSLFSQLFSRKIKFSCHLQLVITQPLSQGFPMTFKIQLKCLKQLKHRKHQVSRKINN